MSDDAFWMVWNPRGYAPTVKHASEGRAISEAERLARANPEQEFYVLESVALRQLTQMVRKSLRPEDDDAPF